jgi:hypothetical protein
MTHRNVKESTFETFVSQDNKSWKIVIPFNIAKRMKISAGTLLNWNEQHASMVYSPNRISLAVIIPKDIAHTKNLGYGSCVQVNIKEQTIKIKNRFPKMRETARTSKNICIEWKLLRQSIKSR